MRLFIHCLFVFFIVQNLYSQKSDLKMDPNYFLLGTFSDYIGRSQFSAQKDAIERYFPQEKALVNYLNSMLKENNIEFKIDSIRNGKENYITQLKDLKLNVKLNSFYNFDSFDLTYPKRDTIFKGKLKKDIFFNDTQKYSFIAGVYSRYGEEQKGNLYGIRMHNSVNKISVILKVLEDLDASEINYEIIKNIPTNHLVYFKPNDELKKYLDEVASIKDEIRLNLKRRFQKDSKKQ